MKTNIFLLLFLLISLSGYGQFHSNFQTVCPGQAVVFSLDGDANSPSWSWNFPGATAVDGIEGTSSTNRYPSVVYSTPGVYSVTFVTTGVTRTDYISVRPNVSLYGARVDNNWRFKWNSDPSLENSVSFDNDFVDANLDDTYGPYESSASISNIDGNALFHSSEQNFNDHLIYDRLSRPMLYDASVMGPNPINASESSSQKLIVPFPGECQTKYYLFSTSGQAPNPSILFVSTIDMSLNNGYGMVTELHSTITLPPGVQLAEAITAIPHCDGERIWVLVKDFSSSQIYSMLVGINGTLGTMNPCLTSDGTNLDPNPPVNTGFRGTLKPSPAGNRIASGTNSNGPTSILDIYTFFPATGMVLLSNNFTVGGRIESCEFSSNGQFIYAGTSEHSTGDLNNRLYQCETFGNGINNIILPGALGEKGAEIWGLELASDGNIYFVHNPYQPPTNPINNFDMFLGRLTNVNTLFTNSTVIDHQFFNWGNRSSTASIANGFISRYKILQRERLGISKLFEKCKSEDLTICASSSNGLSDYTWYKDGVQISNAFSNCLEVSEPGFYSVEANDPIRLGCKISMDFEVKNIDDPCRCINEVEEKEHNEFCINLLFNCKIYKLNSETGEENLVSQPVTEPGVYKERCIDDDSCITSVIKHIVTQLEVEEIPLTLYACDDDCKWYRPPYDGEYDYYHLTGISGPNNDQYDYNTTDGWENAEGHLHTGWASHCLLAGGTYLIEFYNFDSEGNPTCHTKSLIVTVLDGREFVCPEDQDIIVCPNTPVVIGYTVESPNTYEWLDEGNFNDVGGVRTITATESGSYSLVVTTEDGCKCKTVYNITLIEDFDLELNDDEICLGEDYCTVFSNLPVDILLYSTEVIYDFGDGTVNYFDPSNPTNPMPTSSQCHTYSAPGSYNVTVTYQTACGPITATSTVLVKPWEIKACGGAHGSFGHFEEQSRELFDVDVILEDHWREDCCPELKTDGTWYDNENNVITDPSRVSKYSFLGEGIRKELILDSEECIKCVWSFSLFDEMMDNNSRESGKDILEADLVNSRPLQKKAYLIID